MRPLALGSLDGAYVFASESCAFDTIGAEFIRDVRPGEVLVADKKCLTSHLAAQATDTARELARKEGVHSGFSAGAAVYAALKIAERPGTSLEQFPHERKIAAHRLERLADVMSESFRRGIQ